MEKERNAAHLAHLPVSDPAETYVWPLADDFTYRWLDQENYAVTDSAVFDQCIGYRCRRKGRDYTVFMFACGAEETFCMTGPNCGYLAQLPFAADSTVLVLYLYVEPTDDTDQADYRARPWCTDCRQNPVPWKLTPYNGSYLLEYFLSPERDELVDWLMYAYNREDQNVYNWIISHRNPFLEGEPDSPGISLGGAFYMALERMHRKYGDMRLGYVRYGDGVYWSVPYVEGLGYFTWDVNENNRITGICRVPFDDPNRNIEEFIKTDRQEPADLLDRIPKLTRAIPLPPRPTERFAALLYFDNAECRKLVLPIPKEAEQDQAVQYEYFVMSDGIWASAQVVPSHSNWYIGQALTGPALLFKNELCLSNLRCYMDSRPYIVPAPAPEQVYRDARCSLRRLWTWSGERLTDDPEGHLLIGWQTDPDRPGREIAAVISYRGQRLSTVDLDRVDNFQDGYAVVGRQGYGLGYIDRAAHFLTPLQYDRAEAAVNDMGLVQKDGTIRFVNPHGQEVRMENAYVDAEYFNLGRCAVASLRLTRDQLAYYTDDGNFAGIWGFIDEHGQTVITPQYLYAGYFVEGIAVLAKGQWTREPKGENGEKQNGYCTEEEHWGGIDRDGNTVIPFIFDEIQALDEHSERFAAHYGGWDTGAWGVIDRQGNWLVQPQFENIYPQYLGDLLAFYPDTPSGDPQIGVYDIVAQKVLFDPQFEDVEFLEDGGIKVMVYDKSLGRTVEKILERNGQQRFPSIYSTIWQISARLYQVSIHTADQVRYGIVDQNGRELVPCQAGNLFDDRMVLRGRYAFTADGKVGIKTFDGQVIVPAIYERIDGRYAPLYIVQVGTQEEKRLGLITPEGQTVLPPRYQKIEWCGDNEYVYCRTNGQWQMFAYEETEQ